MTPAEQDKAFKKAVKLAAGERGAIQDETVREVVRLLNEAGAAVTAALEAQPSDFMAWYLPQLRKQIEQTLIAFGEAAGQAATAGQTKAWGAGQALIDAPLAAAQVRLIAELPRLDTRPLLAMQLFLTGKMKDVGLDTLNRVNGELALTVIGAQGVATTIERIQEVMGGVSRRRAITIVRTELGRAFAAASQQRAEQAAVQVPGLKKQWRRSGKIHSRRKHDLTDGQVRPVNEPFILGTGHVSDPATHGGIRIMYPHDPAAPPAETINCGCISLPYMDAWKDAGVLQDPGKRPFSEEEIRLNPVKQELAGPGLTMGEVLAKQTTYWDPSAPHAVWHDRAFAGAPLAFKQAVQKFDPQLAGLMPVNPGKGAFYRRGERRIHMAEEKLDSRKSQGTWRHEYGHFLDHQTGPGGYVYRSIQNDFTALMRQETRELVMAAGYGPKGAKTDAIRVARKAAMDQARDAVVGLDSSARSAYLQVQAKQIGLEFDDIARFMAEDTIHDALSLEGQTRANVLIDAIQRRDPVGFMEALESGLSAKETKAHYWRGLIGKFSDLVGSASKNKILGWGPFGNGGHPDSYLKDAGSSQTEVFANLTALLGSDSPLWQQATRAFYPRLSDLYMRIISDVTP